LEKCFLGPMAQVPGRIPVEGITESLQEQQKDQ